MKRMLMAGREYVRGRVPGARDTLREVGLYALAFVVLPNAAMMLLGEVIYLARPPLNVDYVLLAPLFALAGAVPAAVGAGVLLTLDLLQSILPGYQISPQTALESMLEVSGLPPVWSLTIGAGGLGVVVAVSWLVRRGLGRLPRALLPALVVLALVAATVPLEARLQSTPAGKATPVLRHDLVTSALVFLYNGIRDTRGGQPAAPVALDVPAATTPIFEAISAAGPVPDRIVLVVVESYGLALDTTMDRLQRSALEDPRLDDRYRVIVDTIPFYGSTVPAELRELCRVHVTTIHPVPSLIPPERCLPVLLGDRGYQTVAVHGFPGSFFRRASWYPGLGFDEVYLGSAVHRATGSDQQCGLAYVGSCDGDIADWFAERLRAATDGRLFLYWLTLNAHTPAPAPDPARVGLDCEEIAHVSRTVCRLLQHHDLVIRALANAAASPDVPPTLFIIVGDHPPHLVDPNSRRLFDARRVQALLLWPSTPASSSGR